MENKKLTRSVKKMARYTLCTGIFVKLSETRYTAKPTTKALDTPPNTYPIKIT